MPEPLTKSRLVSLDAYRGLTMFLLIAEAALLYESLTHIFPDGSFGAALVEQFHHHPWNGLRFWDLIQPFFMFIVGVAMPFSLKSRLAKGATWSQAFKHILFRCAMLLAFGVGLHCVYNERLVWELWNVLTQLSFTILVAFLLMRLPIRMQIIASLLLLMLTEVLYRIYDPAAPFIKDENFGSWMDMVLMGKINPGGGWVTINCIPTAAHTLWGAVCGTLLILWKDQPRKIIQNFVVAGIICLVVGYGMDWSGITPIVKRIATTSFVFASGGWCLLSLAFFYWLVDIKKQQKWTKMFVIVGMNSIFIYLFAEVLGHRWLSGFVKIFNDGFLGVLGLSTEALAVTNAIFTLGIMWYLCYFLYKKRIFFKI
jgi:predicted acyltransferase